MRRALIAIGGVALVGAGAWYATTRLSQKQLEQSPFDSASARPAVASPATTMAAPPAAPEASPPRPAGNPRGLVPDSQPWPVCSTSCGRERWLVKTLDDPARDRVDFSRIVDATVAQLASLNTAATTMVGGWRQAPIETTVYRVDAFLVGVLDENDQDIHLILADRNDLQTTLIAEIPDPNCEGACASGFASRYALARQLVEKHFSNRRAPVRVTGVGFIDFNHGQAGAAPNQVELHPVLAIEFP